MSAIVTQSEHERAVPDAALSRYEPVLRLSDVRSHTAA